MIQKRQMLNYNINKNKFHPSMNIFKWMLMLIRISLCIIPMAYLYLFHAIFARIIFIDFLRRYFQCITNLICIRSILLFLGFFRFENDSFKFFDRSMTSKFILRSGYIGIANHTNIIDFLFYSYLLSPLFVRMLIIKKTNKKQILYLPLTFLQALQCALSTRGFEPIVIEQKQINKIKQRKLKMSLLVVESFQNLKGPILIMLPVIHSNHYMDVDKDVIEVLQANQRKFSRWTVGFCTYFKQKMLNEIYDDQLNLIFELLCSFNSNSLVVQSLQFHSTMQLISGNNYYQKSFLEVIRQFYVNTCQFTHLQNVSSYQEYISNFNNKLQPEKKLEEPEQNNKQD